MKKILVLLAAVVLLTTTPALAEFKQCVGPDGSVRFVNTECPEGYRVQGSMPASQPASSGSDEEPYICRFADIIDPAEIDSSLAEAEESLRTARAKVDREAERYWTKCLEDLKQRKMKLETPIEEPDTGPAACTEGEFEYKDGGVYFTNSRRSACQGVSAVCTFDVRTSQRVVSNTGNRVVDRARNDQYTTITTQEVKNLSFNGRVGKFGTERIGDVVIQGRVTGVNCQILQ